MTTFALVHGSGDGGWAWHLVQRALRERGHEAVAPDLPTDRDDVRQIAHGDHAGHSRHESKGPAPSTFSPQQCRQQENRIQLDGDR